MIDGLSEWLILTAMGANNKQLFRKMNAKPQVCVNYIYKYSWRYYVVIAGINRYYSVWEQKYTFDQKRYQIDIKFWKKYLLDTKYINRYQSMNLAYLMLSFSADFCHLKYTPLQTLSLLYNIGPSLNWCVLIPTHAIQNN